MGNVPDGKPATDVGGGVTQFTYDAGHRMLSVKDPNGGVLSNVYDGTGRVAQQTDPMNRTTRFSYVPGFQTTITDPDGNVKVETFAHNLLASMTLGVGTPQAATWSYQYDPVTMGLTRAVDPNGHVSQSTYDARGNRLSTTDALGHATTYTYDALNDLTSITDPMGVTTTQAFDANGNQLTKSRPIAGTDQNATTTMTYGDGAHPGDVTVVVDPNGDVGRMTYDRYGNVVSSVDPLGHTRTATFDIIGRRTASVSPNGNVPGALPSRFTTHVTYNAFGQPLLVTDPLNRRTAYTYDRNGNEVTVTDADHHTTQFAYDADNELVQVTRADGSTTRTGYDGDGNVATQTDGLNQTTTFGYDALNRKTASTDPLGRKTTFGYDGAGNLTSRVDTPSLTTIFTYDAADQEIGTSYSDGKTPNVTYGYDADGRRVSMTDGTGTSTYTYDSLNRMTQSVDAANQTVGYGYDLGGHLTSIRYPGAGQVVTRSYDAAGELTAVRDWMGHTTSFAYDADSNLVTQTYPNDTQASFTYNPADELTDIADSHDGASFLHFDYSRDQIGQLTADNSTRYSYDRVNRLSSAGNGTYAYDAADRITRSPGIASLAYDAGDQLRSLRQSSGDTAQFTYDARGNRVQQTSVSRTAGAGTTTTTVTNLAYDQADRLVGFGTAATYAYNGDGLRTTKTVASGPPDTFAWDVAEGLPLVIRQAGISYITGVGGLPVEQIGADGSTVDYYHQDQLGSTRALTDARGDVAARYDYDPYGNAPIDGHQDASTPFRFGGQFLDAESGMYYLRARYYDPRTSQFITRDPAVDLTHKAYVYVQDSPLAGGDPSGLWDLGSVATGAWNWVYQNSEAISFVAGVAAMVPGLDVVAIPVLVVASGITAYKHFDQCDFVGAGVALLGVLPGIGLLGRFGRAADTVAETRVPSVPRTMPTLARVAAEDYAAELRAAGGRVPTAAAAAVDRVTGAIGLGHSKELSAAPPELADILPNPSLEKFWSSWNCAEVPAVAKLLRGGSRMEDIDVYVVRTKGGQYFPPCKNCRTWVPGAQP